MEKTYRITRKIAKHGNQSIITIPAMLKEKIKPGSIVEVTLEIIDEKK